MANLELLQKELEETRLQIQKAHQAKVEAEIAAIKAAEDAKTDADKAAEIQEQINQAKAFLAKIQES